MQRKYVIAVALPLLTAAWAGHAATEPGAAGGAGWQRGGERLSRALAPLPKGLTVPTLKGSVTDPTGDTIGSGPVQIDVVEFSATQEVGDLVFRLDFAGSISPPGSGAANEIDGYIDVDADQNGATGDTPWVDFLTMSNITGMGNEFYVDLFSYDAADGAVDVVDDPAETVVGRAPATFTADSLTVRVPLSFFGGDSVVNTAAVVGTFTEPTDVVPNSGSISSADTTSILLNNDRFRVSVEWSAPGFPEGPAFVSNLRTDDSGIFYFLDPQNLEFLIKVLDGCSITDHFWVFFAATTNVEFTVTVVDTQTGNVNSYFNPFGNPADAVTDTQAFATCP